MSFSNRNLGAVFYATCHLICSYSLTALCQYLQRHLALDSRQCAMNDWLMMEKRFVLYWFFHGMSNNRGRRDIDNESIFFYICNSIYTKNVVGWWPLKSMEVVGWIFRNIGVCFFKFFLYVYDFYEIRFSQSFRQWFCSKMPVLFSMQGGIKFFFFLHTIQKFNFGAKKSKIDFSKIEF